MHDPTFDVISKRLIQIEGAVTKLRLDVIATDAARSARSARSTRSARSARSTCEAETTHAAETAGVEPLRERTEPALPSPEVEAESASPVEVARQLAPAYRAQQAKCLFPASGQGLGHMFERIVSGRGMAVAGLLLILFGCAYFLEYSFTRNWIHPGERIALGLLVGSALLAMSTRFLRGPYRMLAEGTVALGAALSYVSTWASVVVFPDLGVPRLAAFVTMVAITGALAFIANRARSQPIAVMGLAGAYLTPLFGGYVFDITALAAYLLIVTSGMLALARRRSFVVAEYLTIVATLTYSYKFAPDTYAHWSESAAAIVASLFFLIFTIAFTTRVFRDGRATALGIVPFVVTCAAYIGSLEYIFRANATLLSATLGFLATLLLGAPAYKKFPVEMKAAYRSLGVLALNLALHVLLHKTELFDAFSIEGAVFVLLGARTQDSYVTRFGMAFLAVAAAGLAYDVLTLAPAGTAFTPLALGLLVWLRSAFSARRGIPQNWKATCSLVTHLVALAGLTRIGLDATGGAAWNVKLTELADCTLSMLWALFAAMLFALGVSTRNRMKRYAGLTLFAITILKVTTIDLVGLDSVYRIIAFIGLGIALFASSAWYTRSQKALPVEIAA